MKLIVPDVNTTSKIVLSKNVIVSDPCYEIDTWCRVVLRNVKAGVFNVFINRDNKTDRIGRLVAINENHYKNIKWELKDDVTLGVDSGQCGIFDYDSYRNDNQFKNVNSEFAKKYVPKNEKGEKFYACMCDLTLGKESWGTFENGAVSSSGWGDGVYPLFLSTDKENNIVGIMIEFINI